MRLHKLILGGAVCIAAIAAITSCKSEEKRLAGAIPGMWAGTPETFSDINDLTATVTDTYYFSPDTAVVTERQCPVGPITIQAMVSMATQVMTGDMMEPLSLSASGTAQIRGTWSAIGDDEISLSLDPQTLTVVVDPGQVVANGALIGESQAAVDSMRPQVANNLQASLMSALSARYSSMRLMEDVEVKGNLMKYEMGAQDFVLTRTDQGLTTGK